MNTETESSFTHVEFYNFTIQKTDEIQKKNFTHDNVQSSETFKQKQTW